jgi:hypothetical protein
VDILKTWFIEGIPPEHEKPLFVNEYDIQPWGTNITWGQFTQGMDILAVPFSTIKEAEAIRDLIAGVLTDKDYTVLIHVAQNPNIALTRLQSHFKYKDVGDIISKLMRTNNIIVKEQVNITYIGEDTILRYKKGERQMSNYKIKVVSMAQVLEKFKAKADALSGLQLVQR